MKIRGFAFHAHHYQLMEFCDDYEERVKCIRENKPLNEQELRLRLFKMIPQDRLPPVLNEARKAYNEAWEAYEPEIIKLHEELCPNCPWDNSTIFTRKDKDEKWY